MMEQESNPRPSLLELQEALANFDRFEIKPTSDVFIADMLSKKSNKDILMSLINATLEDAGHSPIVDATVCNPFNIKTFEGNKRIILDVRVQDENGRVFNIEIQTTSHPAFNERILFGWANSYSQQISAGQNYLKLKPVICIVLAEFNLFPELKADYVHGIFELRERNHHDLQMTQDLQIHYLRLYDLIHGRYNGLEKCCANLKYWLLFILHGAKIRREEMAELVKNNKEVLKAYDEFQVFTTDPESREYLRQRLTAELDYQMGIDISREEGIAIGEKRGEKRGEKLAAIRIARSLLAEGLSLEFISDNTLLSVAELKELHDE